MKGWLAVSLLALAAPALAQEAAPPAIDWSKPVIVDAPALSPYAPARTEMLPVEVFTIQDLRADCASDDATCLRRRAAIESFARNLTTAYKRPERPDYPELQHYPEDADPRLRNFSPEMREKMRPFLGPLEPEIRP